MPKGNGMDLGRVPPALDLLAGPRVPDADDAVLAAGRQPPAVGTESQSVNLVQPNGPVGALCSRGSVEDAHAMAPALGVRQFDCHPCPIRAESDLAWHPFPRLDRAHHTPRLVPQPHEAKLLVRGREQPPGGRPREGERLVSKAWKGSFGKLPAVLIPEAEAGAREGPHPQPLRAGDQEGGSAGAKSHHAGAVTEPTVQGPPFQFAQPLRVLLNL